MRTATLGDVVEQELISLRDGTAKPSGLPTGLGIERFCPVGIPTGKITTIFGETGNFKSTLASNLANNIAASGIPVALLSFEDTNQLIAHRALARETGVAYSAFSAASAHAVGFDSDTASRLQRIIVVDDLNPTMDDVITMAKRLNRTHGVRAVFVDYAQLLSGPGGQKETLDDAIVRAQYAAKADDMAYVFVSQVKSTVRFRKAIEGGPRPVIDDCLGSSSIRTGTKLALGLFRPFATCQVPTEKEFPEYLNMARNYIDGAAEFIRNVYPSLLEINVSKNVFGPAPACVLCRVELSTGLVTPYASI
jgi:replicative DNA helicase